MPCQRNFSLAWIGFPNPGPHLSGIRRKGRFSVSWSSGHEFSTANQS
jgi:hypothetical protein